MGTFLILSGKVPWFVVVWRWTFPERWRKNYSDTEKRSLRAHCVPPSYRCVWNLSPSTSKAAATAYTHIKVAIVTCSQNLSFVWIAGQLLALKMIGKGFYRKWVKSSFEQLISMQTHVGSTNGWIISQNAEILKFYFSTISGNLRNLWRHIMATFMLDVPLVSSYSAFIQ